MAIPFNLTFEQFSNGLWEKKNASVFVTDQKELKNWGDRDVLVFKENMSLRVYFNGVNPCSDGRLFLEGTDMIPTNEIDNRIGNDENRNIPYIKPGPEFISYFSNINGDANNYYPLIPGDFVIEVSIDSKKYYTWMRIESKQIEMYQWVSMRYEIEETLRGLTHDTLKKRVSYEREDGTEPPSLLYQQVFLVLENEVKIKTALKKVMQQPRTKIDKQYRYARKGYRLESDMKVMRHNLTGGQKVGYDYGFNRISNHDLQENRWMKKIAMYFHQELLALDKSLDSYLEWLHNNISEAKRYNRIKTDSHLPEEKSTNVNVRVLAKRILEAQGWSKKIRSIRYDFFRLTHADWIKGLSSKPSFVPLSLLKTSSYTNLYKFYQQYKDREQEVTLDKRYDFYFKKTDTLYEIWGFIQIINTLTGNFGYDPISGWIFNSNTKNEIPMLESGTTVEMQREDITLRLVYDKKVKHNQEQEEYSTEEPLVSGSSHDRPDLRIDVFNDLEYLGSVILDFKYQPMRNIYNEKYKAYEQLKAYRDYKTTFKYSKTDSKPFREKRNAANQVIVLYPNHSSNGQKKKNAMYRNSDIVLHTLTPTEGNEDFIQFLRDDLNKIITNGAHEKENYIRLKKYAAQPN